MTSACRDRVGPSFQLNRAHYLARPDRRASQASGRGQSGRLRQGACIAHRAASCCCANASRRCIDPGSPFLEFGHLAREGMYDGVPPGATIITGVGAGLRARLHAYRQRRRDREGRDAVRYDSEEAYPRPVVCVAAPAALHHIGAVRGRLLCRTSPISFRTKGRPDRSVYNQVKMSTENIAQIAVVHGPSTAGGRCIRRAVHEGIGRDRRGAFSAAPTFAATGNHRDRTARRRGDAQPDNGVTDPIAEMTATRWPIARNIVANLERAATIALDSRAGRTALLRSGRNRYGIRQRQQAHPTRTTGRSWRASSTAAAFKTSRSIRRNHDVRICPHPRFRGRHPGQQRRAVFGKRGQGGALHRTLLQARHSAAVPGRRLRLMVGSAVERQGIASMELMFMTAMACADVPKYTIITGGSLNAAAGVRIREAVRSNQTLP